MDSGIVSRGDETYRDSNFDPLVCTEVHFVAGMLREVSEDPQWSAQFDPGALADLLEAL